MTKIPKTQLLIIVTADWNDGDYVTAVTEESFKTSEEAQAFIKEFRKHYKDKVKGPNIRDDWSDKYTKEAYDFLEPYIPYGYESSCHTIDSVDIYEYSKKNTIKSPF